VPPRRKEKAVRDDCRFDLLVEALPGRIPFDPGDRHNPAANRQFPQTIAPQTASGRTQCRGPPARLQPERRHGLARAGGELFEPVRRVGGFPCRRAVLLRHLRDLLDVGGYVVARHALFLQPSIAYPAWFRYH